MEIAATNPVKSDKMSSTEERAAWLKAIDGLEFTARLDSWTDQIMRHAEAATAVVTSPDSDEGRTAQRLVIIGMIRSLVGVGSMRQDGWPRAESKAAKSLKEFVHHEPRRPSDQSSREPCISTCVTPEVSSKGS